MSFDIKSGILTQFSNLFIIFAHINREFSQSLSLGESVSYVAERSEKHAFIQ